VKPMRPLSAWFLAFALCVASSAKAETVLRMNATAKLPPGTHTKLEVKAEFDIISPEPDAARPSKRPPKGQQVSELPREQISYRLPAKNTLLWEFDVPADGKATGKPFDFEFPADLGPVPAGKVGGVMFPIRVWIRGPDTPRGKSKVIEQEYTFGMHYPSEGAQFIQRCLRISGRADHLAVETAPDCKDDTFLRMRRNARRIPQSPPGR
jgi:hypothetical protein